MAIKHGLGKGLDSIIPEKIKKTEDVSRETFIDINDIEPNKKQPRKKINQDAIEELADSIKKYGVIQPLIVKKEKDYFKIIAGERRWRASKLAGLKEVPVIVKEYSSQEVMEIALVENIQREDLNPIEEAMAYENLMKEYHLKQDELADRVSKSRSAITNTIRLLKLCEKVKELLIDDMITSGHARAILPLENAELQYKMAEKIIDKNLSVRETEKEVKKILSPKEKKKEEIEYKDLEQKIQCIIGTKVAIRKKSKNKGKIEIEYYSEEELDRLVELFEMMEHK